MSNKTRSILRAIAVVLVLIAVAMHLHWISVPAVNMYRFWIVVLAFGLMLITSK